MVLRCAILFPAFLVTEVFKAGAPFQQISSLNLFFGSFVE